MGFKDKIRDELRKCYGEFETYLEHKYEETIIEILSEGGPKSIFNHNFFNKKMAWLTYNQVILELKKSESNHTLIKELQYKLTDNDNPKNACLEIIKKVNNWSEELERLYKKLNTIS